MDEPLRWQEESVRALQREYEALDDLPPQRCSFCNHLNPNRAKVCQQCGCSLTEEDTLQTTYVWS